MQAIVWRVVPAQALGAAVQVGGAHFVERGQLHPGFLQCLDQLGLQLRIGKVAGQAPALGVAVVFFPECDFFLDSQGLPLRLVFEVDGRDVDALRGTLVAVKITGQTAFFGRAHQRGDRMVAGHPDHVAHLDIAPGLALDALAVFGGVVLDHATKHINPADLTASAVAFGHLDGVARLDGLFVAGDLAPVTGCDDLRVRQRFQLAEVHQRIDQRAGPELIDAVVASGLAVCAQHLHPDLGHAGRGDAQEAAGDDLAQLHLTVAGAVVPALAFGAAQARLFAGIGQRIERGGAQARVLHGAEVKFLAVHTAGDGAQIDRAAAGHQIGTHHIGQGVGINAVESQRQADGHRSRRAGARQRGRQRGRAGDGVDGGEVFRAHRDGLGLDGQGIGRVAQHAGLQAGVDAVFGISAGGTEAVGRSAGARAHGGGSGQHGGLDAGGADRLQVQLAAGLYRAVHQLRPCGHHRDAVADQAPLAFVRVVLVDQVYAVAVGELVANVFVNVVAHQGRVEQHTLALDQLRELVVLVVGGGLVVIGHVGGRHADQVARHRQADGCGFGRAACAKGDRSGHRAQVGADVGIVGDLDLDVARAGALGCIFHAGIGNCIGARIGFFLHGGIGRRVDGCARDDIGPLRISLGAASDAVQCERARA